MIQFQYSPGASKAMPWIWTLFYGALALGALFVVSPLWLGCPPPHPSTSTLTHIKQIGTALSIYTEDFDGSLPTDTSSVPACREALMPLLKNKEILLSKNPGSPQFLGNGPLSGQMMTDIADQDRTLLFFDSAPWKDKKSRVTAYVDTRVRKLSEVKFQSAIAKGLVTDP